eukprot:4977957-Lingulodinium_polyedra.AAC.1
MASGSAGSDCDVVRLVKKYAAPLNAQQTFQVREMARLLETGKAMLKEVAAHFMTEAGSRPLLLSYASDGTPVQFRHRLDLTPTVPSAKKLKMGKGTGEFL